ncbi:MAG: ATP-binding cassette domain-containing protein [Bacteroidota bacterium]
MSERILKALMQLFAIIAPPESNASERRQVVGSFLRQQLNQELVEEYLKVFDDYYQVYQEKQSDTKKRKKSISLSSVKVLKICTAINEELTQKQKIVVCFRLLEFIKSDFQEITEQELEFVETVADTFHIDRTEYNRIKAFALYTFNEIPNSSKLLVINDNKEYQHPKVKHSFKEFLKGTIWVFHVDSVNMHVMRYLGENELYLNGQLLQQDKIYVLTPGSSIRDSKIKPVYYSDIVSAFIQDESKVKTLFEVKDIIYKFKGGSIGLHTMNFSEESGKLVGIMGASGAGKSTLLNVLNGTYCPSEGSVMINGVDIHRESEKVEGLIGNVSQYDLLIEELTVFQNLYYNAKLCFDNYSEKKIIRTVLYLLQSLGLYEIKDMKVGSPLNKKISGGQRKRLNISLELIREPAILFLDEPTSGLSSRDSENIMDLLKELTLKGKLVFVVIHQPSSDIFKMFDKLLILDNGGYLVYNGDPVDSIIYFKSRTHQANWNESECHCCGNVNPEQVFNIVESHVLDEYGNPTHTRKTSPKEWYRHFNEHEKIHTPEEKEVPKGVPEISFKIPNRIRQFKVFTIRDFLSKITDKQYVFFNLFETPILALTLAFIIKYFSVDEADEIGYTLSENSNLPVYIFMSVIIAIFVGLTVSAEEIIKDRKILKRESFLNLSRSSYLISKVVILLGISALQALTFVLIGNTIMEIRGMYWQYWIVLFSAWSSANLMGLNISDSFKQSVTIYILIPFLVIPQIILSGIIVKFDKLNPDISSPNKIPWYGEIITARWAYEALAVYTFKENRFEEQFYSYDKIMSVSNYRKDYWIPTVKSKIAACKRNLKKPDRKDDVVNDLEMIRIEIQKEIDFNDRFSFPEKLLNKLYPKKVDMNDLMQVENYLDNLNEYYKKKFKSASNKKDSIISCLQATDSLKQIFIGQKKKYRNESLVEFVTNKNELDRIIEYHNNLYQKIDPIYQDPTSPLIKAHFYAPRKRLFGIFMDTYWANIFVIWIMTIVLYITLYFSGLKRLLDLFDNISDRIKKRKITE